MKTHRFGPKTRLLWTGCSPFSTRFNKVIFQLIASHSHCESFVDFSILFFSTCIILLHSLIVHSGLGRSISLNVCPASTSPSCNTR